MNQQALSGIKVIEFSDLVSGPYCGKMLAMMGAEVIKIEKPGLGDPARRYGPFPDDLPDAEKSGLFLFLNSDKDSVTLDVATATGHKIFLQLIKSADILIQSHSRKEMERLGLSYSKLLKFNTSLIVTSITPFGQSGPFKDYQGNDLIACHAGAEAFGNPDEGVIKPETEPPLKTAYHASDIMSGLTAASLTMAALIGRQNTGQGIHIDLSQQEAVASTGRQQLAYYAVQGLIPSREWGRKKFGGFLYPGKDGYVVIWIGPHYARVMDMLGNPDWSKEEMFTDPLLRNNYIVELNQLISAWTREHTVAEINELAITKGVPCSLVRSVKGLVEDEQMAYRQFWQPVQHPAAGKMLYPGPPFRATATPLRIERAAPLLGEHNEQVYCRLLGYRRSDLVKLRQAGVI